MKKKEVILLVTILVVLAMPAMALPNPSAVYCNDLGYEYQLVKNEDGSQTGICDVEGTACDAWEFYSGKCAPQESICAKKGYSTVTVSGGEDPYSQEYAVCVDTSTDGSSTDGSSTDPITGMAVNVAESTGAFGKLVTWLASYMITGNAVVEVPLSGNYVTAYDLSGLGSSVEKFTIDESSTQYTEDQPKAYTADAEVIVSAPTTFDWRNVGGNNWVTPVKNQGGCGSCWAFSAIGTTEAKLKITRGDTSFNPDLSEQQIVSCDTYSSGCGGGYHDHAVNTYIDNSGVTDEWCMPYTATTGTCSGCSGMAARSWQIDDGHFLADGSDSQIMQRIYDYGPVGVNYYHYGSFDANGIYRCSGETNPFSDYFWSHWDHGHATVIVGYDDNLNYWIVKNSWGSTWNGDGYFKVGFGECEIGRGVWNDRRIVWVDKVWPTQTGQVNASSVNIVTGHTSGSWTNMNTRNGQYLTVYDQCSGTTCDGSSVYIEFPESKLKNPQYIDLMAYFRGRDDPDFKLYYKNPPNIWPYLGLVPQTSNDWRLIKYSLCDTEAECEDLIQSGVGLTTWIRHLSCTSCNTDYMDLDWFVIETETDTDDDGVMDQDDECPTQAGTWCRGCPQPGCGSCSYNPVCPASGPPYCSSHYSTSTYCGSLACSAGTGNNYYAIGGEYSCLGYCDGSGNCDYAKYCLYSTSCDPDDDNDGELDGTDLCPGTAAGATVDTNGCSQSQVDSDLDGTCSSGKTSPTWCTGTDACPSQYGTACNGCPAPSTNGCRYNLYCPPSGTPYYTSYYDYTQQCDATYRCSIGSGDNKYNMPGEYKAQGYCDGSGNCDYASNIVYDAGCDPDDDNDGVADLDDICSLTPKGNPVDVNGCSQLQVDADADQVCDSGKTSPTWCTGTDQCASTAGGASVDTNGCSQLQVDEDNDQVCNPAKTSPLWCKGTDDCLATQENTVVDSAGCNQTQVDADVDGICDPAKTSQRWCIDSDNCPSDQGPFCNGGCPDSTPPELDLTFPLNTTYTNRSVPITLAAADLCLDTVWLNNGTHDIALTENYNGVIVSGKGNSTIWIFVNDSSGNINSTSAEFNVSYEPNITIADPDNKTYMTTNISIEISIQEPVNQLNISFDGRADELLCSACDGFVGERTVSEGEHNTTVTVLDEANELYTYYYEFFADAAEPHIYNYNFPPEKRIKGNSTTEFLVNYTETMLDTITFTLNLTHEILTGCLSGQYQTCTAIRDLTVYNHGCEIYYGFTVNDTSGREHSLLAPSGGIPYKLTIDRHAPNITVDSPVNETMRGQFTDFNMTLDENATIIYSLDSLPNTTFCEWCDNMSIRFTALPLGPHNVTVWANDSLNQMNITFIVFAVHPDFDRDGDPDITDPDDDNDGLLDADDKVLGNQSDIDNNFENITVEINETDNISQKFNATFNITFRDNGLLILRFKFNFSRVFNMSNVTIQKQPSGTLGKLLIRGLQLLGEKKTVFVDDLDPTTDKLCIKDAEVESLDNITSGCSASDEHLITCPGITDGYNCTMNGTKYMIEGLAHSAITEFSVPVAPLTGGGGGGGGGGAAYASTITIVPTLEGQTVDLTRTSTAQVLIAADTHVLDVTNVGVGDILFTLDGYYYTLTLFEKEIDIDIDKDAKRDITVVLDKISSGKATLIFRLYNELPRPSLLPPASPNSREIPEPELIQEEASVHEQAEPALTVVEEETIQEPVIEQPADKIAFPITLILEIFVAVLVLIGIIVGTFAFIHRPRHDAETITKLVAPVQQPALKEDKLSLPLPPAVNKSKVPPTPILKHRPKQTLKPSPSYPVQESQEQSVKQINKNIDDIKKRLKKLGL